MKCPKCKAEIEEGALFCTHCGKSLPKRKKCVNCGTEIPLDMAFCTHCGTKQPVLQEKEEVPQAVVKVKTKKISKTLIGVLSVLIVVFIAVGGYFLTNGSSNGKRSFQDIQISKNFVNDANEYFNVKIKISWPESLEGGDVKPLQTAIMNKAFGYSKNNIDEAISAYFASFGKEIDQLPEWNMEITQYNVSIEVKEETYIKGRYSAFSVLYINYAEGGSFHAADVINRYVNYDIQNQMVLSAADIFNDKISHSEILREIKRSSSGEWSNVKEPNELPKEVLLTDSQIHFAFDGWQPRVEVITIGIRENLISPRIKNLLLRTETINETANEQEKDIINNLYTNYVFGNEDFSQIAKDICSPKLLKILKDEYEYDCEDGECYAVWIFRTTAQDGTDVNEVKNITSKGNGWYEVSYIDMGNEGMTSIKFIEADGKMIMDEIKKDKSFN